MSFTNYDESYFFLIDCNQFFVSCEQLFNPKLIGQPVVVLSTNDGCVISRSKEAKALGIPMGAAAFKYTSLFKEKKVHVYSSNFGLYGDMSRRVMHVLSQLSPDIEEYSIDEAFLFLHSSQPHKLAKEIQEKVVRWTGIPVSVGVGKTKTLAKLANDLAKKREDLKGVFVLDSDSFLKSLPVKEIWGIGSGLSQQLNQKGIHTILQLKNSDLHWLKKCFSVALVRIALELQGTRFFSLQEESSSKQSILCSRSFTPPITALNILEETLANFTARAAEKLREEHAYASYLTVFITTSPFKEYVYANAASISLTEPTNYTPLLITHAKKNLQKIYRPNHFYKRMGILLTQLTADSCMQRDLFNESQINIEKQRKCMQLLDRLNLFFGKKSLYLAAENQNFLEIKKRKCTSQRFTTQFEELLTIQI